MTKPIPVNCFVPYLQNVGPRCSAARSASEAFKLFKLVHPDVMVSDIGMPFEDGYELIRKVRALPEVNGGKVPAVALTAYARPGGPHESFTCWLSNACLEACPARRTCFDCRESGEPRLEEKDGDGE